MFQVHVSTSLMSSQEDLEKVSKAINDRHHGDTGETDDSKSRGDVIFLSRIQSFTILHLFFLTCRYRQEVEKEF